MATKKARSDDTWPYGILGKSALDIAAGASRSASLGIAGLMSDTLAEKVLGSTSRLDSIGISGLIGQSVLDMGIGSSRSASFGIAGLMGESLAKKVLGSTSRLASVGVSGLIGQSVLNIGLDASRSASFGIAGLMGESLAEKVLGSTSRLASIGISGLIGQSVLNIGLDASRSASFGIAGLMSKSLAVAALSSSKVSTFGISRELDARPNASALGRWNLGMLDTPEIHGTSTLFESLTGIGALNAWDALAASRVDAKASSDEAVSAIINTIDQDDPIVRLTSLMQATLEEVQRLSAQSRSVKAKVFEAMTGLSFLWMLVTILASTSEPEWVRRLNEALQEKRAQEAENYRQLTERLQRLEELQRLDRSATADAEKKIADGLLEIQERLSSDLQNQIAVIGTRTPLRVSPRKNGRVLEKVVPGTAALIVVKRRKWVYVLLLDETRQPLRGGWIASGSFW
jgi:hypothetical protein